MTCSNSNLSLTAVRGRLDKKPAWLKIKPVTSKTFYALKKELRLQGLVTVCEEAKCPNINECWSGGTATMMILGDTCTRFCKFCNVKTGNPRGVVDQAEPKRVGEQIAKSLLKYVVITCVDRDDLADGGASVFRDTLKEIKKQSPGIRTEALISDYAGSYQALKTVLEGEPDVLAHNVETVEALTPIVRDRRASYQQSLTLLARVKETAPNKLTKSSLMVGLGETWEELEATCRALRQAGVDIITFGQYLRPSQRHLSVKRYYSPAEFKQLEQLARELGFLYVASAPLVRSSYRAAELFLLGHLEKQTQLES